MSLADTLFSGDFKLQMLRAIRQDILDNSERYSPELVHAANYVFWWSEFADILGEHSEEIKGLCQ